VVLRLQVRNQLIEENTLVEFGHGRFCRNSSDSHLNESWQAKSSHRKKTDSSFVFVFVFHDNNN
jgi:hypothetical protein